MKPAQTPTSPADHSGTDRPCIELVFPAPVWLEVSAYLAPPPADPCAPLPADPAAYAPLVLNLVEVATATPHWGPDPGGRTAPPATVVRLNTGQLHWVRMPFRLFVAHLMKA
jgi:hypothetical protein